MFSVVLVALPILAQLAGATPAQMSENLEARNKFDWVQYGCRYDCYDGMNRFLSHKAFVRDDNNPDKCIQECRKAGYKFAGLQFKNECWCGNELAGAAAPPKDCWMRCANGALCGGACRNTVWGVPGAVEKKQ